MTPRASRRASRRPALTLAAAFGLTAACGETGPRAELPLLDIALQELATVGVLDGHEVEEFGMILAVRALPDGSFFVLDPVAPAVSWFEADGTYLGGVSDRGQGPGELQQPHAFAVDPSGRLLVSDRRNSRLNVFRFDRAGFVPDGVVPSTWMNVPAGHSICLLGERHFLHHVIGDHTLHEVDDAWTPARSFGPLAELRLDEPPMSEELALLILNRGVLECLNAPPMLVLLSQNLPWVRAFTPDGELIWETEVTDVRPQSVTPDLGLESDPDVPSHQGVSIVRWSEDALLVQYRVLPPDPAPFDGDAPAFDSRVLSLSDGSELGRIEHLPRIMATSGDLVYALEEHPYPRVRVLRREG